MANESRRIKHVITMLSDPDIVLSDWETRFVSDIDGQFERKGTLTDKQYEKLEEIYTRRQER